MFPIQPLVVLTHKVMPQSGVDSVPSDMLAYVLAQHLRDKHNQGTSTCLNVITSIKYASLI
jgi:short subunit dehydrogenase-like uncharacterized protein